MITLTKLAKEAHVSVSTVSKAFSLSDEVNEKTREEIFKVARKYGCFKKYYRAKYPSIMIAVICPEFKSDYYSSSVSEIARRIREYDCRVCAAETRFSSEEEKELIRYYSVHSKVDGIILVGGGKNMDYDSETPIVHIGVDAAENIPSVSCDIASPMREAVEYFVSRGITDIGFIGEILTEEKQKMFSDIMTDVTGTVKNEYIGITEKRFSEGGYDAAEKIFSHGRIPRGLICAYDEMAMGAIRCIKDHGLSVPGDVAVIGMDDIRISPYFDPPLSSIDSTPDECLELAIRMLTDMIFEGSRGENINLTGKLKLRASSEV